MYILVIKPLYTYIVFKEYLVFKPLWCIYRLKDILPIYINMEYGVCFKWSENIDFDVEQIAQLKCFGVELKCIVNAYYMDYTNYDIVQPGTLHENEYTSLGKERQNLYKIAFENTLKRMAIYASEYGLEFMVRIKKQGEIYKEFKHNHIYSSEYQFNKVLF